MNAQTIRPDYLKGDTGYTVIVIDEPASHVRRTTLNRSDKRNALNHALRGEILQALRTGDMNPEVHVQIIRGAGSCFPLDVILVVATKVRICLFYCRGLKGSGRAM